MNSRSAMAANATSRPLDFSPPTPGDEAEPLKSDESFPPPRGSRKVFLKRKTATID